MPDIATLLERFRQGDRLAVSRLLSLLARGEQTSAILSELDRTATPLTQEKRGDRLTPSPVVEEKAGGGYTVAITGSAGVGKSTLIGKLIAPIRETGHKVAVLACDPQSPLSGGALLGDRFRMSGNPDEGVFIRSLPALSGHSALAEHLPAMIRLLSAAGFDVVLIETVGAGQGDTAVAELADRVVLLLQPETGDDLQWEKAGVLEVADVIAVQKADMPKAEQVADQVRAALELSDGPTIPVLLVSAKTGQNVSQLWQMITESKRHRPTEATSATEDELLRLASAELARRFHQLAPQAVDLQTIAEAYQQGRLSEQEAGQAILALCLGGASSPGKSG